MNKSTAIYAEQLFEIARRANRLEELREELNSIILAIEEQPKFIELLIAPSLDKEAKKELIISTFSEENSKIIVDFLKTLVEEERIENLVEIGKMYRVKVSQYLEDHFGIVEGTVYSAVPLNEEQLKTLVYIFTKKVGKTVRLNAEIDESLIAGYKVNVGNMVYDSTIKLQLKQLKESLMSVDLG